MSLELSFSESKIGAFSESKMFARSTRRSVGIYMVIQEQRWFNKEVVPLSSYQFSQVADYLAAAPELRKILQSTPFMDRPGARYIRGTAGSFRSPLGLSNTSTLDIPFGNEPRIMPLVAQASYTSGNGYVEIISSKIKLVFGGTRFPAPTGNRLCVFDGVSAWYPNEDYKQVEYSETPLDEIHGTDYTLGRLTVEAAATIIHPALNFGSFVPERVLEGKPAGALLFTGSGGPSNHRYLWAANYPTGFEYRDQQGLFDQPAFSPPSFCNL